MMQWSHRVKRLITLFGMIVGSIQGGISPIFACPGCQNPNLPVVPSGGVFLGANQYRWGTLLTSSLLRIRHGDGCNDVRRCDLVPVQPSFIHDQRLIASELRSNFGWGITRSIGITFEVPIRIIYTTIEYETPDGQRYEPLDAGIHHRNETLIGIGDSQVAVRMSKVSNTGLWMVGTLGITVPLGRTEKNPFTAGERGEAHQHVQMGTGTFDPLVTMAIAKRMSNWQLSTYGQLQGSIYQNSKGFQSGLMTLLSLRSAYRIASRTLLQSTVSWFHQGAERWDGKVQEDGVQGRQEILFGMGTTMSFGGPQYLLLVQTPIWRKLYIGPQTEAGSLSSPITLTLGIQGQR